MTIKLKSIPEDFEVEELTDFPLGRGPYSAYLLTKRSLGTPEAITAIQQRWQLDRRQISYGGLKDKHAVTRQWVTIFQGPRRNLEQSHLSLVYQGQAEAAFTPQHISGNRFAVTLRGLSSSAAENALTQLPVVSQHGVPNYFDDQRFGSVGVSGQFVAQPWCQGDYERTLWLAIAEPNVHDRPDDKADKQFLRDNWGDWLACKARLGRSSRRSIVTFLCDHPTDFRRAVALIRQDLRSLYLSAFQSHLWNRLLAVMIEQHCPADQLFSVKLELGAVPFYRTLTHESAADVAVLHPEPMDQGGVDPETIRAESQRPWLVDGELPLPSARLHFDEGDPLRELYQRVLQPLGLELSQIRVKYPRDSFFSKGLRAAVCWPRELQGQRWNDELNAGRTAVRLQFCLPRGAYATMLVKRLTWLPPEAV
jgi:tRNA pseudouridine13 synthase